MPERLFVRLDGDPLYAPETSVPAGTMHDFAVSEALQPYVASVMAYREQVADGGELTERVLPDGAIRLIFDFGDTPSASGAEAAPAKVVGASATPVLLRLRGRIEGISVALRPGAARALLGVPAGELSESAVALDTLWPREGPALFEQMAETRSDAVRARLLQRALLQRLRAAAPGASIGATGTASAATPAARAARLIASSGGTRSLRDVADSVGVGERRLQQLFHAQIGLSPRAYSRLARMHACLRALRNEASPQWARVAADVGFYDQSHLVNEFRALCGLTPGTFLERARA